MSRAQYIIQIFEGYYNDYNDNDEPKEKKRGFLKPAIVGAALGAGSVYGHGAYLLHKHAALIHDLSKNSLTT